MSVAIGFAFLYQLIHRQKRKVVYDTMDMENWLSETRKKLDEKMRFAAGKAAACDFIPYSTMNGEWAKTKINWWTNGFWGAAMWQMFRMTGDVYYRDAAVRAETMMDDALRDFENLHHDVGFMWLIQSGVRYALENNAESRKRTLLCANLLAGRYNPNGFIRAWNAEGDKVRDGWSIIDSMMNLPLLYWASRETKDPRYKLIAMRHADTAIRHFVREDGSCNHIVIFDAETGAMLDNPAGQGAASGSSWSRGQAWAIYGFALSYRMTGKKEYLDTAIRVARYFLSRISQSNWLPACDLQPAYMETDAHGDPVLQDNAAGAIAACGLLEIADFTGEEQYREDACKILKAMDASCADWTTRTPAILQKCTSAYHDIPGHHISMIYADYFFIEAVNRLSGSQMSFWAPDLAK